MRLVLRGRDMFGELLDVVQIRSCGKSYGEKVRSSYVVEERDLGEDSSLSRQVERSLTGHMTPHKWRLIRTGLVT